jgi:hypothetical protein
VPGRIERATRDWYLEIVHASQPARSHSQIVVPIFVEAWERTNAKPLIDPLLWKELKSSPLSPLKSELNGKSVWQRIDLWRQNRKIKSRGTYAKLFAGATDAYRAGQYHTARRLAYRCPFAKYSCVNDLRWLKLLVKLHLNSPMTIRARQLLQTIRNR